jgi:hypothetical protein
VLHVTNGDVAVERLRQQGAGGDVISWHDVLHEGPVPAVPEAGLRAVRAGFLAATFGVDEAQVLASLEARDARLQRAIGDGEEIVLWFETDLFDQLQLIDVLRRLDRPVPLVLTEPGAIDASRRDEAHPAGPEAAVAAWAAFTAPTPEEWRRHAPLRRLLQEVPWHTDALRRSERQLLRAVAAGATTKVDAFLRAAAEEEHPYLGDTIAFGYLDAMAPLVTPEPLTLTARGEAVVQRKERWDDRPPYPLGGVEDATLWRYRLETGTVSRRAASGP